MPRKKVTLEWTAAAEVHLEEIRARIARDSPVNAERFIARIKKAVQNLKRFPASGEVLRYKEGEQLREIYVRSYRVIFRVRENSVRIIAVIHAARDFHLFEESEP
jgi:plasmid stabilization system protein ParE